MFDLLIHIFFCSDATYHILPSEEGSCSLNRNAVNNENELSIKQEGWLHGSFAMAGNAACSTFRMKTKDKNSMQQNHI